MSPAAGRPEIRGATREDIPAMGALWRTAFNVPQQALDSMPQRLRVERLLVAEDGGRIAATAQAFAMRQWFGGRPVSTAGIASVAVQPLYRGTGVGSAIMHRLLARARDRGHTLSSLYPATVPVYRRLGYEYAGVQTTYRIPIDALPAGHPAELVDVPPDAGPIRASHERLAVTENGLLEGVDDDWWPWRVLGAYAAGPRGAVMTTEDVPDGYAAYEQEALPETWGYRISCSHLIAHTSEAAFALLSYFRKFKGVGQELEWHGPPNEPLMLVLGEQNALRVAMVFRSMSRILDVPAALESRGYPDVTGAATFSVEDPLFPENAGPFLLEAEAGKVRITREPARRGKSAAPPISIGALSTMFAAFVPPIGAARTGLVDPDHPALPLLTRLFAGPTPWTPDFF
jgi:predicted acetyltransferase